MLDKPGIRGFPPQQQPWLQPVICIDYWLMTGSFQNWNFIAFLHKAKKVEDFKDIYNVAFDGISDNMSSLVQYGKYGAINKTYTSIMGYYMIKYVSDAYNLQYDITCDWQISSSGKLVVKAQYLVCMQAKKNCYWQQKKE